jgi:hypothetical protein
MLFGNLVRYKTVSMISTARGVGSCDGRSPGPTAGDKRRRASVFVPSVLLGWNAEVYGKAFQLRVFGTFMADLFFRRKKGDLRFAAGSPLALLAAGSAGARLGVPAFRSRRKNGEVPKLAMPNNRLRFIRALEWPVGCCSAFAFAEILCVFIPPGAAVVLL